MSVRKSGHVPAVSVGGIICTIEVVGDDESVVHVLHVWVIRADESEFEGFDGIERDSAACDVVEDVDIFAARRDDGIVEEILVPAVEDIVEGLMLRDISVLKFWSRFADGFA